MISFAIRDSRVRRPVSVSIFDITHRGRSGRPQVHIRGIAAPLRPESYNADYRYLVIFLLHDLTLALVVDEAASLVGLLASPEPATRSLGRRRCLVSLRRDACHTEENSGEEEARHGCPDEAESVLAKHGCGTSGLEVVASDHVRRARNVRNMVRPTGYRVTYVISAAVRVWKNRAIAQSMLERKLPIRLQRAKRPRNSEQTPKKSEMRMKANMNRVR